MKFGFEIKGGGIVPVTDTHPPILVFAAPTSEDKQDICTALELEPDDLESVLDPDEMAHVEFTHEQVAIIWKRPKNVALDQQQVRFDISSVGLFLHQGRLVIVMAEETIPFSIRKEFLHVNTPVDVLLGFLRHTVHHYLGHLKVIKQITSELGSKISASLENRYLLQMFSLSESLIYYLNAIETNNAVLAKLHAHAQRLGLTPLQVEALHDIALDYQQCARQAHIYSSVLSGLMDARGTIVNNNVNVLLKNLTLINVIFLPLTLLASIGGMSEFSMMTHGIDWRISYSPLTLGMMLLGWGTWIMLVRILDKRQARQGLRTPGNRPASERILQ